MHPVAAPPLRKMMKTLASVFVTGGSSGAGKSFITLSERLQLALPFCNPSWHKRDIFSVELKPGHVCRDLGRKRGRRAQAEALLRILNREVPEGRVLVINTCEYGSDARFLESEPDNKTKLLDGLAGRPGEVLRAVIKFSLRTPSGRGFQPAKAVT